MGGTISVESKSGQGSSFTVILEYDYAEETAVRREKQEKQQVADISLLAGCHVLLCEDLQLYFFCLLPPQKPHRNRHKYSFTRFLIFVLMGAA